MGLVWDKCDYDNRSEKLKEEYNFAIYMFRTSETLYEAASIDLYKSNPVINLPP